MTVFFCTKSLQPCALFCTLQRCTALRSHATEALRMAREKGKKEFSSSVMCPQVVHPDQGRLDGYRKAPELIVWLMKEQVLCPS